MSTIAENAKSIFLEAVEKQAPENWPAFLDEKCGDDRDLRGRVEGLLQAHAEKDSLFDRVEATRDFQPLVRPGQLIGPYKIREQIGDGGMGVVYVAEQERPLRRKVALKVIKPGMDSKAVLARFDAERNALALMNHPNIARVLDAGTTEHGHPYFVMELIQGKRVTEYCDQKKLTINQRLELFTQICNAVQHAHQKGVIHRDIKPTNILVTEIDGKPVPKVIDFGVAKALGANLTDRTVYTSFQALVGTPLYMSPEQTQLSGVDVDTSSDVYSLGILLYELLTGTTPLSPDELKQAAQEEVLKRIRETEPPRPSNRISSLGEASSRVCECRGAQPEQLGRLVRGDLDWIVMKALEKDRNRRYRTADAFAADIGRHLANEAVEARPPSTLYRLRKFTVRNRMLVGGVSAVVLGLAVAMVGVSSGLIQARHARDELQVALQSLADLLVHQAFSEALSGNRAAADEAIEDAALAGVDDVRIDMLRAVLELCSGQEKEAVTRLKDIVKRDGDCVEAWAMLSMAYEMSGNLNRKYEAFDKLERLQASSDIERLFVAWADVGHGLREQPVAELRSIVDERPSWAVPRLILGQALVREAVNKQNVVLARQALTEVDRSKPTFGENPFVWSIELEVLTKLARLSGEDTDTTEWQERAERIANKLEQHPGYVFGLMARVWYYTCLREDDMDLAFSAWEEAIEHGAGMRATAMYMALLNRENKLETAMNWDRVLTPGSIVAQGLLGDVQGALRRCEESTIDDPLTHVWIQRLRYVLGQKAEARQEWNKMLKSIDSYSWPVQRPLRLFTKQALPHDLLDEVADAGSDSRAHALLCIAAFYVMERDYKNARKYLEECVAENNFTGAIHYIAQSSLAHHERWIRLIDDIESRSTPSPPTVAPTP